MDKLTERIERIVFNVDIFDENRLTKSDSKILTGLFKELDKEYSTVGVGKKTGIDWLKIKTFLESKIHPGYYQ